MHLDMIGLVVKDMAASLRFYRALGLAIPESMDREHHVEVTLPNGLRIGWDTTDVVKQFDPGWTAPKGSGRLGMAFLCESSADVDATYKRLVAQGFVGHKEPWDAFWGQRYAQIKDPDGNSVDLFAWLPGKKP